MDNIRSQDNKKGVEEKSDKNTGSIQRNQDQISQGQMSQPRDLNAQQLEQQQVRKGQEVDEHQKKDFKGNQ